MWLHMERSAEFPKSFTLVLLGDAYSSTPRDIENLKKAKDAYTEALDINRFSSETLMERARSSLKRAEKMLAGRGK